MPHSRPSHPDLNSLAHLLDTRFRLPFGFRVGWDGILGLVPGVGDLVTSTLSLYLVFRAAQMNCPPAILLRMGGNILVENLVDAIPVVGSLFDFVWKANSKNLRLLNRYQQSPSRTTFRTKLAIWGTLGALVLLIASVVGLALYALISLIGAIG